MFQYSCGRCGKKVEKSARICPHCGVRLGNLHCKHCGFVGTQADFMDDRCPQCKAVVRTSSIHYERCKECGRKIETGQWTCPYCGHTRWGVILALGGAGLGSIILAVVFLPLPTFWTLLVGGVGVGLFFSSFYGIGGAMRLRGGMTFFLTILLLSAISMSALAARYRFSSERAILEEPSAVVAAAGIVETPVPTMTVGPTWTPAPSPTPPITAAILPLLANIRTGPGTEFDLAGDVAQNEAVMLIGHDATGGWMRIKTKKGTEGWIWRPLLEMQVDWKTLPEVK